MTATAQPALDVDEVVVPLRKPPAKMPPRIREPRPPRQKYDLKPEWWDSPGAVLGKVWASIRLNGNNAVYHGVLHGHAYAWNWARYVKRGAHKLILLLINYVFDYNSRLLEQQITDDKLRAESKKQRLEEAKKRRIKGVLALIAAAAYVGVVLQVDTLRWKLVHVIVVAYILQRIGRTMGDKLPTPVAPIVDPAKMKVTSDRLQEVFEKAGFKEVMSIGGVHRRGKNPDGWISLVDLAEGDTFGEVTAKHEKIASAWRLPAERLYLAPGGHAGQLHLTMFDEDPMVGPPVKSPLAQFGSFDLWKPIPLGRTELGDRVELVLPGTSHWISSSPGYGKTHLLRLLLAAAALAPRALIYTHDGKGEGDLTMYDEVATWATDGHDDEGAQSCLSMLDEIKQLIVDRAKVIKKLKALDPKLMPTGQITRDVTENPEYGLPLVVVLIDEGNLLFEHPTLGNDIRERAKDITRVGRSGGVIFICAGQRFDSKMMEGLKASIGTRVAFRTTTPGESNVALGDGMVGLGYDASKFQVHHKGICIIRPGGNQETSGPWRTKCDFLEVPEHIAIAQRAAAVRRQSGVTLVKDGYNAAVAEILAGMEPGQEYLPLSVLADQRDETLDAVKAWLDEAGVPYAKRRQQSNKVCVARSEITGE